MKAKKRVPENSEQPKPLLAPSNEERKDELAGWQKLIVALAEARLSIGIQTEQDVVFQMQKRAIGLCRVAEDFALAAGDNNELSMSALGELMEAAGEAIQVAKWLTSGRPLYANWE